MMTEPQTFTAPDGTEMVIITRARFQALLDAEETLDDLDAAREGAESIARDGGIPFAVSNAIAAGKHPIAAWRKHRDLTQAELAEKVGLTQAAIARLEKAEPGAGRADTLDAIAAALDAPRWAIESVTAATEMSRAIAASAASAGEAFHAGRPVCLVEDDQGWFMGTTIDGEHGYGVVLGSAVVDANLGGIISTAADSVSMVSGRRAKPTTTDTANYFGKIVINKVAGGKLANPRGVTINKTKRRGANKTPAKA